MVVVSPLFSFKENHVFHVFIIAFVPTISHCLTLTCQQDMYKNAEKVLNDKEGISKSQVRNAVAKARIELNVRKISTMIHLIQPPSHDEVILPKNKNSGEYVD